MPKRRRTPQRLHHEPEAVRWARERAGLTQTQLAEITGLSRTLLVEVEAGTRNLTPPNLRKVAEALNCPPVILERKRVTPPTTPAPVDLQLRNEERTVPRDVPGLPTAPAEREREAS